MHLSPLARGSQKDVVTSFEKPFFIKPVFSSALRKEKKGSLKAETQFLQGHLLYSMPIIEVIFFHIFSIEKLYPIP